jgi:proton-dependent oligopeptide transporter, POT family
MSGPAASQPVRKQRTFLGHPLGLYILFFTEMWERFSYYGMRALLILYMVNYFKWTQKDASTYYKVYTSFVYVTPILGGYLADRYLGNRKAVIIGAVLMAIGHFLMAFEEQYIFLSALVFLIFGNGFFKPNMSTQVGRLYTADDGRRDGAYTIFYMGINLGAFLSPLVCSWLAENTVGGYHSGFTMAGIGMVIGLLIYLLGQPLIKEIASNEVATTPPPANTPPGARTLAMPDETGVTAVAPHAVKTTAPLSAGGAAPKPVAAGFPQEGGALSEEEASQAPSVLGPLAAIAPLLLGSVGAVTLGLAPILWWIKRLDQWDAIMLGIVGVCLLLISFVCAQVRGGMRDRVMAILTLGVFVMLFWAAAEQAGNVLTIWADKNTNRYVTETPPSPRVKPEVVQVPRILGDKDVGGGRMTVWERFSTMFYLKPSRSGQKTQTWGQWLASSFNPLTAASFQAINPLAIVVFAPLFAWLWLALDRRKLQPSIPIKMTLGLVLMTAAMAVMLQAAKNEHQETTGTYAAAKLPPGIEINEKGQVGRLKDDKFEPFHAGRLTYDPQSKEFTLFGVLPDLERDRLIEETAPKAYRDAVEELKKKSEKADWKKVKSVEVKLNTVPPGFDWSYSGLKDTDVQYRPDSQTLVAFKVLADKEVKGLLVAAGDPLFRDSMNELFVASSTFMVSWWWLFWSYILTTLGELCLSPVGLSMVSKLAPAKFATMLMGVWMLTSAFGNFAAGALGEVWGTIPPIEFFLFTTLFVGIAALVLLAISRWVRACMHGVM